MNKTRATYNLRESTLHSEEKTVWDMTEFVLYRIMDKFVFEHPIV